jgi:hypothetical protein
MRYFIPVAVFALIHLPLPSPSLVWAQEPTTKDDELAIKARCLHDGKRALTALAISPDGKLLAWAAQGQSVHLWDLAAGKELRRFDWNAEPSNSRSLGRSDALAFSPDGKLLLAQVRDQPGPRVRMWDVSTGATVALPRLLHLEIVGFSANGRTLGFADPVRHRPWGPPRLEPAASVNSLEVAFFVIHQFLDYARVIRDAWRASSRQEFRQFRFVGPGESLPATEDPSRRRLQAFNEGWTSYWAEFTGLSPDGTILIEQTRGFHHRPSTGSGGHPIGGPTRFLDAVTGKQLGKWPVDSASYGQLWAMAPNAQAFLIRTPGPEASEKRVYCLWDFRVGKVRLSFPNVGHASAVTFSPDGRIVAIGTSRAICLFDALTGGSLGCLPLPDKRAFAPQVVSFTPDGKQVVVGTQKGSLLIWDLTEQLPRWQRPRVHLTARERDSLWSELAADDAAQAHRAIARLVAAPVGQAVPYLRERLPLEDAASKIKRWLDHLDSEQFDMRQKATLELEGLGNLPAAEIRRALVEKPTLEKHQRLERLLRRIDAPLPSPEELRLQRALETLELIGTPEASQLLEAFAKLSSNSRVCRQAAAAFERLCRRSGNQ